MTSTQDVAPLEYEDNDSDFGEEETDTTIFTYKGATKKAESATTTTTRVIHSTLTVEGPCFNLPEGTLHPANEVVYRNRVKMLRSIVDPEDPPCTTQLLNYDLWAIIIAFLCNEDGKFPSHACNDIGAFIALSHTCRALRYAIDTQSTWFNLFIMQKYLKSQVHMTPKENVIADKWYSAVMMTDLAAMTHLLNKGISAQPLTTPSGYLMETYTHVIARSRPVTLLRGTTNGEKSWFMVEYKNAKVYHASRSHKGALSLTDMGSTLASGKGDPPAAEERKKLAEKLPANYVDHLVRSYDFCVACGMIDPSTCAVATRAVERDDPFWNDEQRRQFLVEMIDRRGNDVRGPWVVDGRRCTRR